MSAVRTAAGYSPTDPQQVATKAYVDSRVVAASGGIPTYIQSANPGMTSPGVWYQTDATGAIVNVWVETGGVLGSDSFTQANGTAWSSSWTQSGGTTSIQSNRGQLVTPASNYTSANELYNATGVLSVVDSVATFTVPAGQAVESYLGLFIDADGPGYAAANSYAAQVSFGSTFALNIRATKASSAVSLGSVNLSIDPTQPFKLRMNRTGTTIQCKAWQASSSEPAAWTLTASETGTALTGRVAVGFSNGGDATSRTATVDDFQINQVN